MPTALQNQVIDPILSRIALGYKHPDHVGSNLFPIVPVASTGGQVLEFGKESFLLYNTSRAPGAVAKRARFGYQGKPYAVENHALDAVVPREWLRDASVVPKVDLGARAVNLVLKSGSLILENQQAGIARNAANYDVNHKVALAGTSQWNDYANSSPLQDVKDARAAIRKSTGIYPNVMLISATVMEALEDHPAIVNKIKYTQRGIVTADILASLFKVKKVVVGEAIAFNDAGVDIDIWGKDVVLAYVPQSATSMEEPSYGYTYQIQGHPMVEVPFWEQATRSWVYGMTNERVAVKTGIASGFLIQNAVL